MEEGKGALQEWRSAQERERSGRRAGRGRQKGGNETVNTVVTITQWLVHNHSDVTVFLNSTCKEIGEVPSTSASDNTLTHRERNTVQHTASRSRESSLEMRDLQARAIPCNG
jgi:hypothetical protein